MSDGNLQVRAEDEHGALLQLAARWAEMYPPLGGDSMRAALERFRVAHNYLDAVIHDLGEQLETVDRALDVS